MTTLIDFYADWCAPCQAMKPVLASIMPAYEEKITLEKVDVEADPAKAQEFGVMGIPTFVLLQDGKEIDRKVGMVPEPMLKQWLDSKL